MTDHLSNSSSWHYLKHYVEQAVSLACDFIEQHVVPFCSTLINFFIKNLQDIYEQYENIILFILGIFITGGISYGISYYFDVRAKERRQEELAKERRQEEEKEEQIKNRLARGRAALERRNWQRAIDHFDNVLVFQPDHPQALISRGLAYYRLGTGDVEWALEDYNQAIELDPDFTEAYVKRGTLYLEQGNYDQAIQRL